MTDDIYSMTKSGFHEAIRQAKEDAWDAGAEAAWSRSTPEVNGQQYKWRTEGEPLNPYRPNP